MEGPVVRRRDKLEFMWSDRYLVLKDAELLLFKRRGDPTPRRTIVLTTDCYVAEQIEPFERKSKDRHETFYTFRLVFPGQHGDADTASIRSDASGGSVRMGDRKPFAMGLFNFGDKDDMRTFEFGAPTQEAAREWKKAVTEAVTKLRYRLKFSDEQKGEAVGGAKGLDQVPVAIQAFIRESASTTNLKGMDGKGSPRSAHHRKHTSLTAAFPMGPSTSGEAAKNRSGGHPWRMVTVKDGIAIWRSAEDDYMQKYEQFTQTFNGIIVRAVGYGLLMFGVLALKGYVFSAMFGGLVTSLLLVHGMRGGLTLVDETLLMAQQTVRGTPEQIRDMVLMHAAPQDHWMPALSSSEVVEKVNEHSDIVYLRLRPIWLWPIYGRPRDLVLMRYWRQEEDGCHFVIFQSTNHTARPRVSAYERGTMSIATITIAPRKPEIAALGGPPFCQVSMILNYNPNGWGGLWTHMTQRLDFVLPILKGVMGLREECALRDFVDPKFTVTDEEATPVATQRIGVDSKGLVVGVRKIECSAPQRYWGEPDASLFEVRGPTYLRDHTKVHAGPAAMHLVGVDVFSFEDGAQRRNIATRPDNIISKLNANGTKNVPFTFVVNLIIPCAENISAVLYFQPVNPQWQHSGEAWVALFLAFIDGDRPFRDHRFKLIPNIVQGNFIIRRTLGVPPRPAIIGNKGLRNGYLRGRNFFEVDVDVDSDPTARNVTGLVVGATKTLALDIAFLVESQSEGELPEVVLGSVRFDHIDLARAAKWVPKEAQAA